MPMTKEKILKILSYYEDTLQDRHQREFYAVVRDPKSPYPVPDEIEPVRHIFDVDRPGNVKVNQHMMHCIFELRKMLNIEGMNREKAMRWLGFLQGAFWADGVFTVRDLMEHNSPDPVTPDVIKEWQERNGPVTNTTPEPVTFHEFRGAKNIQDAQIGEFVAVCSNPDIDDFYYVTGEYRRFGGSSVSERRCTRSRGNVDIWLPAYGVKFEIYRSRHPANAEAEAVIYTGEGTLVLPEPSLETYPPRKAKAKKK